MTNMYNDPTPLNINIFEYDQTRVSKPVFKYTTFIRKKMYGKHVRESISRGIEIIDLVAQESKKISDEAREISLKTEKRLDNQIASLTEDAEVIDARIDENGKIWSNLSSRLNRYKFDLGFKENEIKNFFLEDLFKLKSKINTNLFNLIWQTDLHYLDNLLEVSSEYRLGLYHVNNAQYFDGVVDCICYGGDNTHSSYELVTNILKDVENFANKVLLKNNKSDHFIFVGNHDDGSDRVSEGRLGKLVTPENRINEKQFKKLLETNKSKFSEKRNGDSLYFFKDYPEKKIRLIGLYTNDIPDNLTREDGRIKYSRWHTHAYREEQLDWLANEALKTVPDDFHILITGHYPLEYFGTTISVYTDETIDTNVDQSINNELFIKLLLDFKYGNSGKLINNLTDFSVNIDYDFSKKGNLIGIVTGHTHMERIFDYQGIKIVHCLNSLGVKSKTTEPEREVNTVTEDAFYNFEIDTKNRNVNIFGFGAASNRSFKY